MRIARNRQYLTDLFAGPFPGHAIIMNSWEYLMQDVPLPAPGDVAVSTNPVQDWVPWAEELYTQMVAWHEALDDDSVPYVRLWTGSELFAAALDAPVHLIENDAPCALPRFETADEADTLVVPDVWAARPLARVLELGQLMQERLGKDVIIGVPDMQSPFDIAALLWRKEDLFVAMYEEPEAVHRLVEKCHRLLHAFIVEFLRLFPNANLCACPNAWAPPALGPWMAEDEIGSMSVEMFETFSLPWLTRLSDDFGGLSLHCCASADHQYPSLRKIPHLHGLNRVFQAPGPRPAIETFSGHTVLVMAWIEEADLSHMLDIAQPDTRFLFNMPKQTLDDARRTYARLRERCPRQASVVKR